jgi:hypothetical protein
VSRPKIPSVQDETPYRSTLEKLLEHAADAARIAGHLDAPAVEPLADHVDAIVHGLTELLGDPTARVPRARQAIIDASLAVRTAIAHELSAVLGPHSKVMVVPSDCSIFALAVVRRDDDGPELEGHPVTDQFDVDGDNDEPTEIRPCPALPTRKQLAEDAQ